MERIYAAALQMVPGIGSSRLRNLIAFFGSAQQAWQANRGDLFLCRCLDETSCNNLLVHREKIDIHRLAERWRQAGICICLFTDHEYPPLLREIFNPPYVLFYRGRLPRTEELLIAIVGARRATSYGRNVAQMLGAGLAAAGIGVVSGAARGIDTAAHKGALQKGPTYAVLGCGVDVCYPPENAKILAEIAETGGIISEYAPGTPPHAGHFPARNRIINGMCRGVVVVEAGERSGALITVDYALEEGRDVFAVPGSIFSEGSKGVHRLLKQGAKLVTEVQDILEEYDVRPVSHYAAPELLPDEAAVYGSLDYEHPLSVDEIVVKTNLPASKVTYALLQLELRGLIGEDGAKRYIRTAREGDR
ncbi:DNA-processing protein DprA [Sporolituus thermophilus]|uniref:DNA processing protein n=1 Tax=Sporolituus thermophilus DSM 23256 TaxID=1123285 RepID=A0A1G7KNC8_9FIRM|nr:DNA-processing protein DprA [Sporolituus thermophilus]SDF38631.1 DNA processing protein [Sporolituus thermophilus DSM 23256]